MKLEFVEKSMLPSMYWIVMVDTGTQCCLHHMAKGGSFEADLSWLVRLTNQVMQLAFDDG